MTSYEAVAPTIIKGSAYQMQPYYVRLAYDKETRIRKDDSIPYSRLFFRSVDRPPRRAVTLGRRSRYSCEPINRGDHGDRSLCLDSLIQRIYWDR